MDFAKFIKSIEKTAIDNSPAILTAFGITGTLATAYLTGKASFKAGDIIAGEALRRFQQQEPHLEKKDTVVLVWKLYIPAAVTGIFTIGAIIGANHVSTRRATAMATAYAISERTFTEYKEKVVEKLGEKKEREVRDEIARDRVERNPPDDATVIITDNGDVLCYDHFSGRYFKSSMESLKRAENEINHQILHDGYASLSDLYFMLSLPSTSFSDEVGWGECKLLKLEFSTVLSQDNRPCISIDFDIQPTRNFDKFAR